MNGWAKVQFAIAALATAGFAAVGGHGFRVAADAALFALHTQLALVATLALVLSQGWMALFAIGSERRLRALLAPGATARVELARVRDRVAGVALAALGATLVHFALAGRLFASQAPRWIHACAALAALAVQCLALAVEARELARHQRLVAGLSEAPASSDRVLNTAGS
jgi:hypothetical protein